MGDERHVIVQNLWVWEHCTHEVFHDQPGRGLYTYCCMCGDEREFEPVDESAQHGPHLKRPVRERKNPWPDLCPVGHPPRVEITQAQREPAG